MLIGLRGGALFTGYVCLSFMLVACEPTVEFNPNQIDADTGRWYNLQTLMFYISNIVQAVMVTMPRVWQKTGGKDWLMALYLHRH